MTVSNASFWYINVRHVYIIKLNIQDFEVIHDSSLNKNRRSGEQSNNVLL